jgi:hypothetical protein
MIPGRNFTKQGYYDSTTGKVHTGEKMKAGYNIQPCTYFSQSKLYINIAKGGIYNGPANNTTGNDPDVNGYVDSSGGGSWSYVLVQDELEPGDYVLRWEGSCSIAMNNFFTSRITSQTQDANGGRVEIANVPAIVPFSTLTISGGTCTNIEFLYAADEARYDAGEIVATPYKQKFGGMAVARVMDLVGSNISPTRHYSDGPQYNNLSWISNGNIRATGAPTLACAKFANEMDCDLWWNAPPMGTDACFTQMLTELHNELAPSRKIYIELANEWWNSFGLFNNAQKWFVYGDVQAVDAPIDWTTGRVTVANHGLSNGDELILFNVPDNEVPFWSGGTKRTITNVTTNTFDFSDLSGLVSKIKTVRYKKTALSTIGAAQNYAQRCVELWDIAISIFGRDRVYCIGAGQAVNPGQLQGQTAVEQWQYYVDYYTYAGYWGGPLYNTMPNFINSTPAQITAYVTSPAYTDLSWDKRSQDHIDAFNTHRFVMYEGGTGSEGGQQADKDKSIEWQTSFQPQIDLYDYFMRSSAEFDVDLFCQFKDYEDINLNNRGSFWGVMGTTNDLNRGKYVGYHTNFVATGGCPKF